MIETINTSKLDRNAGKKKALYEQVTEHLRHQIDSGQIKPGDRLPTISSLVSHWKVNYRTINNALDRLREDGLIRLEAGRGKRPLVLRNSKTSDVIMYVRGGTDALSMGMTEGIKRFSTEKNLEYLIVDASVSPEQLIDIIKHASQQVSGIAIMPIYHDGLNEAVKQAIDGGVKIVFMDRILDGINASSVSVDHVAGAYQVTTQLILRHQLPVFFIGYDNHTSNCDRYKGWATAMGEAGFRDIENYAEMMNENFEEQVDVSRQLKICTDTAKRILAKDPHKKHSIFTVNDYIAKGVYQAADQAGLKIGEDVYIVSFGNLPMCMQFPVPLASIEQKNEIVGYEAAKLLYLEMQGLWTKPMHRKVLGELINRPSSGL
jgi:DNA-binding LacI/PurR family transcriptional regulator